MFLIFAIGMVVGAALLASLLSVIHEKPVPFKLAVMLLLLACLASQWIIADRDNQSLGQYQHLSGGRGDGLK